MGVTIVEIKRHLIKKGEVNAVKEIIKLQESELTKSRRFDK